MKGIVLAAILAVSLVACSALESSVHIDPGLTPRMTPGQVEGIARDRIGVMQAEAGFAAAPIRIVSLTASTEAGIRALEPSFGDHDPPLPGILWLVRAEGTFSTNGGGPGATSGTATTEFFVIDDADGSIVGFGFP